MLAFATRTWDGWDYIPHAWPVWLEASDGVLLVACAGSAANGGQSVDADGEPLADGQPIAISRVALLSPTEGWVEGIRVDPRVRGMGVATDLQTAELHWLASHEAAVTRYATGARNEGSHRLGARHGFEPLASYRTCRWIDPGQPTDARDESNGFDEPARLDAIRRRKALLVRLRGDGVTIDAPAAASWWRRLDTDRAFNSAGRLYELRSWAQQELTQPRFERHAADSEVVIREDDAGWALAIVSADAQPAEDVMIHLALAGQIQRAAAERMRFRVEQGSTPDDFEALLSAAGFDAWPWELHILSRPGNLPPPGIDPRRLVMEEQPRSLIRPPA